MRTPIIFDYSKPGKKAYNLPEIDVPEKEISELIPENLIRKTKPRLPEVSEFEIVRHYHSLARRNYAIDDGIYPLGSCTMKYNPRVNERVAKLSGFTNLHPLTPQELSQGALKLMFDLGEMLKEITGMDAVSLAPAAGAHGELTGLLIMRTYFKHKNEKRTKVLIPDSAHGTNPASVMMAGFEPIQIKSNEDGYITLKEVKDHLDKDVAALMVTNPNTLGIFEPEIVEIIEALHENGSIAYTDGANLNALIGISRPGDIGFDIIQLNLHKTFSSPHGGGGPGSGPVLVKEYLKDFLPVPVVSEKNGHYFLDYDVKNTCGMIKLFYGNFSVMIKAFTYILMLGEKGLVKSSKTAILNANYLKKKIENPYFKNASNLTPMHEFVVSALPLKKETGVRALDIAKALLDRGLHAPTMYFPLIVEEALMIEPTETESKESLDKFAEVIQDIVKQALENRDSIINTPVKTPIKRVNEAQASRNPKLKWLAD
ncbi:MAG: aminomethyl-transferring glycine dehydrogenase subunit GcvPB [Actinobacteria bacterium]|nr:aminomethyl-transferring glycine dehydrogenase subunit GcvPB [Actinomycetota bacterium]